MLATPTCHSFTFCRCNEQSYVSNSLSTVKKAELIVASLEQIFGEWKILYVLCQVLPNGNLVFPPFRAEDYRQEVHAQVYSCLARSPAGSVHSRDVNVRAGKCSLLSMWKSRGNSRPLPGHLLPDIFNKTKRSERYWNEFPEDGSRDKVKTSCCCQSVRKQVSFLCVYGKFSPRSLQRQLLYKFLNHF